jgi:hypothetical protein
VELLFSATSARSALIFCFPCPNGKNSYVSSLNQDHKSFRAPKCAFSEGTLVPTKLRMRSQLTLR